MKLSVKTAVFLAVYFITVKAVFAQITVDLDVLTEDFIPKDTITLSPIKEEKKEQPPVLKQKKKTVEKAKAAKKATPPKKPAKPAVKKPAAKTAKKYQVKETAKKDEHDRLKPRANPVPKVKILAADSSTKPAEEPQETKETTSVVLSEPKISKHFLEQERQKQQEKEEEERSQRIVLTPPPETRQEEPKPAEQPKRLLFTDTVKKSSLPAPKTLLSEKPVKAVSKPIVSQPVKFSVFYVSSKLTPAERSAALSKEIPENSATKKALNQKTELLHIFVFEKKSIRLTEEMQAALDDVAQILKKDRNKRLLLYSYSAADPAEPGKERQYALRRALMIRSYLTQKGTHSLRIEMRPSGQKGAGEKIPDRTDILLEER